MILSILQIICSNR